MSLKGYNYTYVILCAVGVLAMFSTQLVTPLLTIFAEEVGATGVWIGFSISAYWVARVFLEIPSGFISTKYGYYLPMVVGVILTTIGNLLCAFVMDTMQLFFARVLMGLGAPLFFAVSMTMVINMFSPEKRGSALGLFNGVEFLSMTLASTFSGYIITNLGFIGGFYLSTIMAAIGIFLMLFPQVRRGTKIQPISSNLKLASIPTILVNKDLMIVCAVTMMNFIFYQGVLYTTYPLYLNSVLNMSLTEIGLIQGVRSIGYVLSTLFMGTFSDRVGRKPILLFGIIGTAVLSVVLNYVIGFYAISVIIFLIGLTTGAVWIMSPVMVAEVVEPVHRGAAIGTFRTFFDIGCVLGPIIMMWVVGAYGYSMPFFISAILLFMVFILSLWLKETGKTPQSTASHSR